MELLYERCCGIDVHKSSVAVCILLDQTHKPQKHLRRFGCTTRDLRELAEWLRSFDVRHVAMESTGVYWKPVWNVLEEHFHMVLANAQHIKAVPGRKTDMMDCQWIAELLRHGLLRGSYVPPLLVRDLRDLTRTRTTLSQEQSRISSRIQKLLESANIKLASTVTHTMGKSGQAILDAIVRGEDSPEQLAGLALGNCGARSRSSNWRWTVAFAIITGFCWLAFSISIASSKPRSTRSMLDCSTSASNTRNWLTRWTAGPQYLVLSEWRPGPWLPRSDRT
jgi:Transposase